MLIFHTPVYNLPDKTAWAVRRRKGWNPQRRCERNPFFEGKHMDAFVEEASFSSGLNKGSGKEVLLFTGMLEMFSNGVALQASLPHFLFFIL